jgi:hypothetical protein
VLCYGIPSIRLGHNLDTAAVVIVDGLVFSYEMFDQFIARVHRLTSKRPVTVYVPLVQGSLDEKKWQLLSQKAQAADLALDGHLVPQREEPVSLEKVLRDLQRAGIQTTGVEIDDRDLKKGRQRAISACSRGGSVSRCCRRSGRPSRRGVVFVLLAGVGAGTRAGFFVVLRGGGCRVVGQMVAG